MQRALCTSWRAGLTVQRTLLYVWSSLEERLDRAEGPLYVWETWPDRAENPLYVQGGQVCTVQRAPCQFRPNVQTSA